MQTTTIARIFSFSSVAIILAVLGGVSGIVGLCYGKTESVPFWVLILAIWIFFSILVILLKAIIDVQKSASPNKPFEKPISFNSDVNCFLIRSNPNFTGQIVVGCYADNDGYEQLAYIGTVHHVQDTTLQIKIIKDMGVFDSIPQTSFELQKIQVKPVVPLAAIQEIDRV